MTNCQQIFFCLLVFRVYYERPVVINSLNLKLRQIARFSSNVILDEMHLLNVICFLEFFLIAQHEERPLCHVHVVTSRLLLYKYIFVEQEKRIYDLKKKNQELEKFKFVLDYKIKELKKQIEPRENDIKAMKEQIQEVCHPRVYKFNT